MCDNMPCDCQRVELRYLNYCLAKLLLSFSSVSSLKICWKVCKRHMAQLGSLCPFPGSVGVMGLIELNSHFHPTTLIYISTKTVWCWLHFLIVVSLKARMFCDVSKWLLDILKSRSDSVVRMRCNLLRLWELLTQWQSILWQKIAVGSHISYCVVV